MRCYFTMIPLTFLLFGPLSLIGSVLCLTVVLYYLDRNPLSSHE